MSNNIDQRVVQMQFDNKQFESGIQTSLKSLDDLKKGLNFDGLSKGISNMAAGIEAISGRFTTMGIAGMTAIQNLSNSAVNYAKNIVESLTIDPVKTGLTEYETKINAIQTILTNTSSKGTTLDDVNASLAELNDYADKTIYNFAQMTDNAGKFTAAGLGLEDSITVIKGLSNVAAGFGVNAERMTGATTQMAQALNKDYIQLTDWMSMETAGMSGEMIKDALKQTAKEMGIVVDASKPFRESLKDGWLTSEVFIATMAKMAEDKSLIAAATNVTTFTKLLGVMQESVQSGWAVSWEKILGDKEQSTELFTNLSNGFNDLISGSVDARNAMLNFWNVNGGRDALIESLYNAFKILQNIIGPIIDGFKEIFPPMTGKRLLDLTIKLRDFTKTFKISDETLEKIKATFKGFFAVISIGEMIVSALVKSVASLLGVFLPMGTSILDITSYIGYFFIGLNKTLKANDAIYTSFTNVTSVLKNVVMVLGMALYLIASAISSFVEFVYTSNASSISEFVTFLGEGFKTLGENLANLISPLSTVEADFSTLGGTVKGVTTAVKDFAIELKNSVSEKVGNSLSGLWDRFSGGNDVLNGLKKNVTNFFKNIDLNDILATLSTGVFVAFMLKLKKLAETGSTFLSSIIGVFDEVRGALKAYQTELKAEALLKISFAIAILAAALLGMTFIDPEKIGPALAAITLLFVDLFGALAGFNKIAGDKSSISIFVIASSLIALSLSLLVLTGVMKGLAKINTGDLVKGLSAIVLLSGTMVAVAYGLSKQEGSMMKSSLGLNAFASAMFILVGVIERVGKIDAVELGQGIVGLLMMVGTLAILLSSKQFKSITIQSGLGLIGIAASMHVMAAALERFGAIKPGVLQQGIMVLGAILISMAAFVTMIGEERTNLVSMGVALIGVATAMIILSVAIGMLGKMEPDELGRGMAGLAGSLLSLAAFMNLMPKNMIGKALALVVVAGALLVLSGVMAIFGQFTDGMMQNSLIMLAGSLLSIAAAVNLMSGAIGGAVAMVIVAGALMLLVPLIALLGTMSLESVGIALMALAGAFLVIGVSAMLLTPALAPLMALSLILSLLSLSFLGIGLGITMFAAGIVALAGSAALISQVLVPIFNMIPMLAQKIGEGMVIFAQTIATRAPQLMAAFSTLLYSLIPVLAGAIPSLVNAVIILIDSILNSIAEYLPNIVASGWSIIQSIMKGIADNIQEVVELGYDIMIGFMNGIAEKLPELIDAAHNMIISFIEGLAASIDKNTPRLVAAIRKLIQALAKASLIVFGTMAKDFKTAGTNIMNTLKDAVSKKIDETVDTIKELPKLALDGIKAYFKDFFAAGGDVVAGFLKGASGALKSVATAGKNIGQSMINATTKVLDINSPSKIFEWIGKMVDIGMADGVSLFSDKPAMSAADMAKLMTDEAKNNASPDAAAQIGSDFTSGIASGISSGSGKVKEAAKTLFELAVEEMDDKKYYNQLTLETELKNWQYLQAIYAVGTEERKKADREVYRVKMELIKAETDAMKKAYDNSTKWIANEKYYNRLSLKQELAAWERVSKAHAAYTDEHIQAEKEIYRVKNELIEKQKTIDKDYYDSTKSINDKLKSDIKSLNDEYENALASKEKSLYDSYGLFDAATDEDVADGAQLIKNLRSQVDALETYRENINELTSKGVSSGLIDELEEMGPKSLSQIQAINNMSKSELETYVHLWNDKHEEAKLQSTSEMEDLKNENLLKIEELNKQSEIDLDTYKQIWLTATSDLSAGVIEGMETLNTEVATSVETLKTETVAEVTDMVAKVTDVIKRNDWVLVGENIVLGIRDGIRNKIPMVIQESQRMALSALQSAKDALVVKSPSKAFEEVGEYADLGFVNGLKKYSGLVADEGGNIGSTALDSIQKAISGMYDLINGDMDMVPVIRPVLDLTDVSSGLASFFGNKQTLNVSDATIKAGNIASTANQNGVNSTSNTSTNNSSIVLNNTYNVRSDSDIRKISQDLKNTMNRYANAKGVLV